MSEIWNNNSTIEEKKSLVRTPAIWQLKAHGFGGIREIESIIKKYRNNGK